MDNDHISDIRERARVMSLLKNRCDIMFTGHLHKRIITNAGGTVYISLAAFFTDREFCRVRVTENGITYEFDRI
jgi:UDP-2,3-diacylglucosamine pyrophosphatase LpxH